MGSWQASWCSNLGSGRESESGTKWGRLRRERHGVRRLVEAGIPAVEVVGELFALSRALCTYGSPATAVARIPPGMPGRCPSALRAQPCTVPVYDPGMGTGRMLALDLDLSRGRGAADPAVQVSAQADAMARLVAWRSSCAVVDAISDSSTQSRRRRSWVSAAPTPLISLAEQQKRPQPVSDWGSGLPKLPPRGLFHFADASITAGTSSGRATLIADLERHGAIRHGSQLLRDLQRAYANGRAAIGRLTNPRTIAQIQVRATGPWTGQCAP